MLTLRNPSEKSQDFSITPKTALELPKGAAEAMTLKAIYPPGRKLQTASLEIDQPIKLTLQPFETIVLELLKK